MGDVQLGGCALRKSALDGNGLLRVSSRLGDAAVDPAIWPEIMGEISAAVGAAGAVLLQSDARTADVPRTPAVKDLIANYFKSGWHARDLRADRGIPLLLRGQKVITDEDIVTPEEMARSEYYAEAISPFGFQWFAAIGFAVETALWAMVIQRTPKQGAFTPEEKRALGGLSRRLSEAATLSKVTGKTALSCITNALALVNQPALVLDRLGFVLDTNAIAERLFDDDLRIKKRRLWLSDPQAKICLDLFTDQLRVTPDGDALSVLPIVVRRRAKRPVVIRILPVSGPARTPFLGARALLIFSDLSRAPAPSPKLLSQALGLSCAEARLASLISVGRSPEQAAQQLGLARETARTQLKAVFAKTETHRQGELIALLSRL